MSASTLRNSLARRNHKERAQPLHRTRLGLLEKHKDYVHRARDYRSKQDRIRKLREKAAFRNKDEFYWGMVKGKTVEGVAVGDRGNKALDADLVKILKTQDMGYVRVQIAQDEKKISKLRRELEVITPPGGSDSDWDAAAELAEVEKLAEMGIVIKAREDGGERKRKGKGKDLPSGHVVFAERQEEFDSYNPNHSQPKSPVLEEELAEDLGWIETVDTSNKTKKTSVSHPVPSEELEEDAREHRLSLLISLSALLRRVRLLRQAESRLHITKALMGKGASRKVREAQWVEDDTQPEDRNGERKRWEGKMWKWKAERRR
ncbi:U3 small nucleolar RNA-associated protein 11 [Tremella mesenterica]|uniref:U3 small nucleolar RNA-associated protein 11 n=1 Tax=Tremella mesenterica TaxID=5217 RepID=A0A4Q1B8B6_TREME|nr:uncharacterized protein TREMEDRAFT_61056 [Tremella mesenterica DSM 1558]EIW70548.1 hypothetical protein TREMEDRAFT_61056 [Tremella mesenterica DSM 1558]RXK34978.1 U3 small nucleolar RNA-associated protein 11 [Tremella mesenterica]